MKIPDNVIAALAQKAGWRGNDLVIATAVAIAESQGESDATNPSTATGLWQVKYSAHTNLVPNQNALKSIVTNAAAAYSVWKSAGWGAWQTYTQGTYKQYLPRAEAAVANPINPSFQQLTGAGSPTHIPFVSSLGDDIQNSGPISSINSAGDSAQTAVEDTANAVTAIPDFLGKLTQKSLWLRIAEIVAGILAIIIGLYLAAKGLQ